MKVLLPPLLRNFGLALTLIFAGLVLTGGPTQAQSNGGQALEIAPPVINLSADPGETVTAEIILRDVSDGQLIVTNEINDFVAGDENGTPKLLLDSDESSPYSMRDWFTPISELLLEPRALTRLPITISVPNDAAPGGYYSVIRFTGTPPDVEGNGVSLSASLGALVLLQVKGDVTEGMAVEEFSTTSGGKANWLFQSAPVDFLVRLKNTGNIHEQPNGKITITDMFGQKVGIVNVNLPPRNILPGSIRKFDQTLDSSVIGNKILFGRYTATLEMSYGTSDEKVTQTITFWVIPYTLIGLAIAGLIAAFIALRFLVKRYNRHIIKQSQKRSRR